jgi:hypothetical protein
LDFNKDKSILILFIRLKLTFGLSLVTIKKITKLKENTLMKSKALALTNGIVGLAGGILLVLWPLLVAFGTNFNIVLRLALIVLAIIAIIYYKETKLVKIAAHVLLIVGGAVAFIPFLGWVGGIIAIVGGSLYLASLKNFKNE